MEEGMKLREILEKSKRGPVLKRVTIKPSPNLTARIREVGKRLEKRLGSRPYLGGR